MTYSKTRKGGTGKTEYRNTKSGAVKPGYGIPNPGQTVSSASLIRINQD